jgi:hypothetical protein
VTHVEEVKEAAKPTWRCRAHREPVVFDKFPDAMKHELEQHAVPNGWEYRRTALDFARGWFNDGDYVTDEDVLQELAGDPAALAGFVDHLARRRAPQQAVPVVSE